MNDEVISIYREYLTGKIRLKDIPIEKINKMILTKASLEEPKEFVEVILNLYEKNMLDSLRLNIRLCLSLIQDAYKDQEFYNRIFKIDPQGNFKYIPDEYRTKEIWYKYLSVNPSFDKFELIPIEFRTQLMWKNIIRNTDDLSVFGDIPFEYIDQELCNIIFNKDQEGSFKYIPDKFKTLIMCRELVSNATDWRVFFLIPRNLLTQDICDVLFGKSIDDGVEELFKHIPNEFKTDNMCKMLVMYCEDSSVLKIIPKERLTKIIFDMAFKKYSEKTLEHLPDELKTKEMYIDLLQIDFLKYLTYVPDKYYDLDVYAVVAFELKKLIREKKTIDTDSLLCLEVIKLCPALIKALSREKRDEIIRNELHSLIVSGGTLEGIAKKYELHVGIIEGVLGKMKEQEIDSYILIKKILADNQKKYFFSMIDDIEKLNLIILSFGNIDEQFLNVEQKIKFAYLYNKCIYHSLEEIYSYNKRYGFSKIDNITAEEKTEYMVVSKRIDYFIRRFFKYNFVLDDGNTIIDMPEKNTILFNNSWLKPYNRDNFFMIKNGIPTFERKYGKDEMLLTLEVEEYIVDKLQQFDIPLNDVIVQNAFREYFNNNLDGYLSKFHEYEDIVKQIKNQKKRK